MHIILMSVVNNHTFIVVLSQKGNGKPMGGVVKK